MTTSQVLPTNEWKYTVVIFGFEIYWGQVILNFSMAKTFWENGEERSVLRMEQIMQDSDVYEHKNTVLLVTI